jgi:tRNA 2-thiocytidine biosynthesis protein TtcA
VEKGSKLFLHLKKWMEKAIMDYDMIASGDRLMIGVSGGMDSLALLDLLDSPMVFVPPFSLQVVHIDLGFDPTYAGWHMLEDHLKAGGYEHVMERTNFGPLAHSSYNRKKPCFLCSRLRRKRIFEIAAERGCNKIVLAHHRDDIIETLLLNMFYSREISTMVPSQNIFAGEMHIIRPLTYIRETLIKKYARERQFPVIENVCPTSKTSRRLYIKRLLDGLEKDNKDIRNNIFRSLHHVKQDYLFAKPVKDSG